MLLIKRVLCVTLVRLVKPHKDSSTGAILAQQELIMCINPFLSLTFLFGAFSCGLNRNPAEIHVPLLF